MKRCMLHRLILFAALTVLGAGLCQAQYRGGRSWHRLDPKEREARHKFVESVVNELKQSVGKKLDANKLSHFEGMARSVVRRMSSEDFKKLQSKDIAEKVKSVAALWKKSKEDAAQRFIKSQPPEVAAELRALKHADRDRRIAELKILAALERAIASAEKFELIQPIEADRLRGLPSSEQLAESNKLNRLVFFSIHGAEIGAKEKARLEKLSDKKFWRDRSVRRFQLLRHINAEELKKLQELDHKSRIELFKALRRGKGFDALVSEGTLSSQTASNWSKLKPEDRRRLMRDLSRVYLPRMQEGIRPNRKQMAQMSREERRQFFMMNGKERLSYLKTKFPQTDWDKQESIRESRRKIDQQLSHVDRKVRNDLRAMMPGIVAKKLAQIFPNDADKVRGIVAEMEKVGWFRSVVPAMRSLKSKLSSSERKNLPAMTTQQQVDFFFKRFAEELDQQALLELKKGGHKVPDAWATMTGSQKVTHLNNLGMRMPWGPKETKFRHRSRRPMSSPPPYGGRRGKRPQ